MHCTYYTSNPGPRDAKYRRQRKNLCSVHGVQIKHRFRCGGRATPQASRRVPCASLAKPAAMRVATRHRQATGRAMALAAAPPAARCVAYAFLAHAAAVHMAPAHQQVASQAFDPPAKRALTAETNDVMALTNLALLAAVYKAGPASHIAG